MSVGERYRVLVAIYAVSTVLGALAVAGWVSLGIAANAWHGREDLDPETRWGRTGRMTVAATLGFGLGGMSASFAGWNSFLAFAAALSGAAIGVASAHFLGVESDGDPT